MKRENRTLIASLTGAAILALPLSSAFAQNAGAPAWYVGAGIGESEVSIEGCGSGVSCDEKGTAWRILGGYRINDNFAVELGYHQFGDATASGPGGKVKFEANAFELSGLGSLPLGHQFSAYGKIGFYRGETKATGDTLLGAIDLKETNTDLTYGIGAQYDFNRQLGLRAEWQRYANMGDQATVGESDVDVLGLTVIYRFQ